MARGIYFLAVAIATLVGRIREILICVILPTVSEGFTNEKWICVIHPTVG